MKKLFVVAVLMVCAMIAYAQGASQALPVYVYRGNSILPTKTTIDLGNLAHPFDSVYAESGIFAIMFVDSLDVSMFLADGFDLGSGSFEEMWGTHFEADSAWIEYLGGGSPITLLDSLIGAYIQPDLLKAIDGLITQGSRAGAAVISNVDYPVALDDYTIIADTTVDLTFALPPLSSAWDTASMTGLEFNFYNQGTGILSILQNEADTLSLGGQDSMHLAQYSGLKLQAISDSLWAVFAGGGGSGGWSGDSLDLRILAVSDSAFIDTLEVHVVNGASPITFLDPIVVDSINPSGGTTTFGGALAASALAVDAFSIDRADVKVRALSTLDFRSYEGFGEIRFGPDSVAWITEGIEALKTHYVLDMGTDASGNIYILTQKSDYALNLWVRDHITGAWSYSSIEAMAGWASLGNMAVSPSGDVFVTWCRDAGIDIKFRARIAGAWQATQIIGSGYNFLSGGVDIENGILGLTYRNASGMIIYNESLNSGASWSADTVVASGAYGSDLAIVDGVPHVVYSSASSTLIERVRIAPSTWSAGNTISPNYVSLPRVESCGDTLATVSARGSNFVYGYRVGDGDWVVEKVGASSQFAIGARFSLSLDSVGSAHLIYRGDDYNIYYWTNASGSWVGTTFNTSGNCTYPALCVDGDVVRASYCAVNQNFSMFSDTLGSGLNTGYSGITMRMNSAVSGAASSIMIDAGGYLNDSSQSGTIYLGDKNGRDSVVAYGPWFCRTVNDAGPMTATNGTEGEIVYNLANDKFYGCTATGTPATWSAFN